MKSILILGAGIYQLPLIRKAKNLGYQTVVASIPGNYPGLAIADSIIEADTKSYQKILRALSNQKINAVITTGTDVAVPTIGKLNEILDLHGLRYEGAVNASSKIHMKNKFIKFEIPTANFIETDSLRDGIEFINKYGFPIMVKAPNSSGGRGITQVSKEDELISAFNRAKKVSGDKVIFEEFIAGTEFGAQAFIHNKKILFCLPHNDTVTEAPFFTPVGHSFPFYYGEKISHELTALCAKICKALDLDNCGLNLDLIMTDEGKIKVIEVGARIGATCLPELVEISYGIDVYKLIIDSALENNITISSNSQPQAAAAELLRVKKNGNLKKIEIPKFSRNEYIINLDYKIGEKVNKFTVGPDRIGQIITTDINAIAAEKKLSNFTKRIKYVVE